tara:strand:+ start:641 stop:883 length:243 start_codon:yes stop_codon:yes gene_type:complete
MSNKWYNIEELSWYAKNAYPEWDSLSLPEAEELYQSCLNPNTDTLYTPSLPEIAMVLREYISGRKKAELPYREYERDYYG